MARRSIDRTKELLHHSRPSNHRDDGPNFVMSMEVCCLLLETFRKAFKSPGSDINPQACFSFAFKVKLIHASWARDFSLSPFLGRAYSLNPSNKGDLSTMYERL
jgi:hypothetical protein